MARKPKSPDCFKFLIAFAGRDITRNFHDAIEVKDGRATVTDGTRIFHTEIPNPPPDGVYSASALAKSGTWIATENAAPFPTWRHLVPTDADTRPGVSLRVPEFAARLRPEDFAPIVMPEDPAFGMGGVNLFPRGDFGGRAFNLSLLAPFAGRTVHFACDPSGDAWGGPAVISDNGGTSGAWFALVSPCRLTKSTPMIGAVAAVKVAA